MDEGKKPTILIVDDEPSVLSLAQMALEEDGYRTVLASRGSEALAACKGSEPVVDVVVVDVVMPGMSGPKLAETLKETLPSAKVIYTSGYGDGAGIALRKREPDATYLKKPFSPDALCQAVASVLKR